MKVLFSNDIFLIFCWVRAKALHILWGFSMQGQYEPGFKVARFRVSIHATTL